MTAGPAGSGTLAAALDRVTSAVTTAVPGLGTADARRLVTGAASRRGALRQLDRHLAAFPDALTSGSSSAPLAMIALTRMLAGAGYQGVRVPRCAGCGSGAVLRHRAEGGRLCDTCYRRSHPEPCAGCGRTRVVHKRTTQGPLCCSCAQPRKECAACGQARRVAARRSDGAPLCKMCHRPPEQPCASCGKTAAAYARTPAGPVCKACYTPPARACGECGEQRPVRRRATADEPDLCERCARRPLAACAACGQQRRCSRQASQPLCQACRRAGRRPEPPAHRKPPRRNRDPQARRAQQTARAHRVLPTRLTTMLAGPVHAVPAQLQPLITALTSAPNPAAVLRWVTRGAGAQLLASLASHAHQEPVTHQMLDTYPQTPALHHLRQTLVHAGVLPERTEYLDRIEPWLGQLLSTCPPAHATLIRPFATWHILRRARRRARRQGFTPSAARWARSHILIALQFLAWLDDRGTTLAAATQTDIDAWLDNATQHRYLVRAFTEWAIARHLADGITVPAIPHTEPGAFPTADTRWQLLSHCLHDTTMPLNVRAAGALLLLYGQFISRITRLTAGDLSHDGAGTYLRIDTTPVLLPPKVAAVICAQRDATPSHVTYQQPADGTQPLFPGRLHGQPIRNDVLTRKLRQHGIEPRQSRNGALAAWAAELPAPVLASILGLHVNTTEQWAQRARRDWTAYIAERATRTPSPNTNTPEKDNAHAGNSAGFE
jgi:hypothetical protein